MLSIDGLGDPNTKLCWAERMQYLRSVMQATALDERDGDFKTKTLMETLGN